MDRFWTLTLPKGKLPPDVFTAASCSAGALVTKQPSKALTFKQRAGAGFGGTPAFRRCLRAVGALPWQPLQGRVRGLRPHPSSRGVSSSSCMSRVGHPCL